MSARNVVVLGKGSLAIKIANWFRENARLVAVVPEIPEPEWTESITSWADTHNIPIVESGHYKDVDESIEVDLAVSVFYGKIINREFISRCKAIINLHNAPLPMYRGVRPINWALKNNESYHGVTIHKITPGIDDGDILGKITYPIYPEIEEVKDVYEKALEYGWLLFLDVIRKFDYSYKHAYPQDIQSSYYSNKQNHLLGDRNAFTRISNSK